MLQAFYVFPAPGRAVVPCSPELLMPTIDLVFAPPSALPAERLEAIDVLRRAFARPPARAEAMPAQAWWFRRFGVGTADDMPAGPFRVDNPGDAFWLCADPVHLQVNGDHVVLDAAAVIDLTIDEARAFVARLNAHFAQDGLLFDAPLAGQWTLRCPTALDAVTYPPEAAQYRSIERFLPHGPDARTLKRTANEAQMLLHEDPVNEARAARGAAAVNGIWLWGGGARRAAAPAARGLEVWSDRLHVLGLARAAGAVCAPLPSAPESLARRIATCEKAGHHALLIDAAGGPADADNWPAWFEATWTTPLRNTARESGWTVNAVCMLPAVTCTTALYRRDLFSLFRRTSLATLAQRPLE